MSKTIVAHNTNITFINTTIDLSNNSGNTLPIVINNKGKFDFDANAYLTDYAGGPLSYNTKVKESTVVKRSYNLNIFLDFIETNNIDIKEVNDSIFYSYIEHLKSRNNHDETYLKCGRVALD